MQREEAIDGPYLRWLKDAKRRVGDRVWGSLVTLDAASASAILDAMGVKPFEESDFVTDHRATKVMVTHITSDWLRPLPRAEEHAPGRVCKTPSPGRREL